jgi:sulfur carrier protein ThiS
MSSPPGQTATAKKITVNNQQYTWELTTLDSLIMKWKEHLLDDKFRSLDASWWLVVVNGRPVPAARCSSVPVSDGDEISIILGRGRYF